MCGLAYKTAKQKKIHKLFRICEKPMAQKLLNAAMLFKNHVYTETAKMCEVDDNFAAYILYHDHCCKDYFNIYNTACAKFIDDWLRNRSISIHSTISKIKFASLKTTLNLASKTHIKDETIKAFMFLKYGCHRGFTGEELLQHEITNSAFFLIDKDGYLRKSAKSQLEIELLKLHPLIDKKGP